MLNFFVFGAYRVEGLIDPSQNERGITTMTNEVKIPAAVKSCKVFLWMMYDLHLSSTALLLYAYIHNSSGNGGVFPCCSSRCLGKWLNVDKNPAARTLKQLLDRDLIVRVEGQDGPGYRSRRQLEAEEQAAAKHELRVRAAKRSKPQGSLMDWLRLQALETDRRREETAQTCEEAFYRS